MFEVSYLLRTKCACSLPRTGHTQFRSVNTATYILMCDVLVVLVLFSGNLEHAEVVCQPGEVLRRHLYPALISTALVHGRLRGSPPGPLALPLISYYYYHLSYT